jgi:hypothetical protein
MRETAYAKINLALHVRAREADGYHRIETIFAFAQHGDELSVAPGERLSLSVTGPFAAGLTNDLAGDELVETCQTLDRCAAVLGKNRGVRGDGDDAARGDVRWRGHAGKVVDLAPVRHERFVQIGLFLLVVLGPQARPRLFSSPLLVSIAHFSKYHRLINSSKSSLM